MLSLKTGIKCLVGSSVFCLSVVTSLPVLSEGIHLLWPFFSGLHACKSPSCYLYILPDSIPALPLAFLSPSQQNWKMHSQVSCLYICFFPFILTERSLLSQADVLPVLHNFLCMESELLHSMGNLLTDLLALFQSLFPEDSLPGNPTDYLPENLEFCFPKVQT